MAKELKQSAIAAHGKTPDPAVDKLHGVETVPEPEATVFPEPPEPESVPDNPRTILVADDEHLLAVSLVHNLEALGYQTQGPAANGRQAVELARQNPPDLALLDIRMPEMDGLEAASVLFCQMGIPVVIVSAFTDETYLKLGAKIGIFGYLVKPVTTDDLRAQLAVSWARYLQHCRLRREVRELKTTLENRKIIERAKGLIMAKLGLTEDAAMKKLQKQARDSRRKMVDLARAILETDELLNPS